MRVVKSIITTQSSYRSRIPNVNIFFTYTYCRLRFIYWIILTTSIMPSDSSSCWICQITTWFYIISSILLLKLTTYFCFKIIFTYWIIYFITISLERHCFLNSSCSIWISYNNCLRTCTCCCTCRCSIFEYNGCPIWFISTFKLYIKISCSLFRTTTCS